MEVPEPSGALAGLRPIDPDDRVRFKARVEAGGQTGWGYYFPLLLAQNRRGRSAVLADEDGGALCIFRWRREETGERVDLYLPPLPLDLTALRRGLERANDFNGDRSARVLRIDAKDAKAISGVPALRVRQRREQYLFAPHEYQDLAGERYRTIRRNVARVERLPRVEVVPFSAEHAAECRALLGRWKRAHRDAHGTGGGTGDSRQAIELAGRLPARDLSGEVVLVGGHVSAFAFGGEIRPGLACAFERKCDADVHGLNYFHFRSFLLSLREFELVNDGSDTGRAGLRQFKDSFRPIEMHAEFRASQRRAER